MVWFMENEQTVAAEWQQSSRVTMDEKSRVFMDSRDHKHSRLNADSQLPGHPFAISD